MIKNESLSDMRVIRDFTTNEEFFPFISSLEENTIKSHLYVQVFGGGTSNTEYETLTVTALPSFPTSSAHTRPTVSRRNTAGDDPEGPGLHHGGHASQQLRQLEPEDGL